MKEEDYRTLGDLNISDPVVKKDLQKSYVTSVLNECVPPFSVFTPGLTNFTSYGRHLDWVGTNGWKRRRTGPKSSQTHVLCIVGLPMNNQLIKLLCLPVNLNQGNYLQGRPVYCWIVTSTEYRRKVRGLVRIMCSPEVLTNDLLTYSFPHSLVWWPPTILFGVEETVCASCIVVITHQSDISRCTVSYWVTIVRKVSIKNVKRSEKDRWRWGHFTVLVYHSRPC